jgi:membrane associated rhomboid family serine protease
MVRLPLQPVRATYLLLAAIGLVLVGQLITAPFPGDYDPFIEYGAKVNALIARGEWWRLVTPLFVHGSLLHFGLNAYALYNLGGEVERFYGALRFLILFFYAGVAGSTASLWLSPAASIGASGAVFGLIGAEAVLLYRNRRLLGGRARAGLRNIVVIIGLNLLIGFQGGLRIDNWAHLGGLAGGLAMAWLIGPVWQATPEAAWMAGTAIALEDRQPLDAVRWLGIGALSLGLLALIVGAVWQQA